MRLQSFRVQHYKSIDDVTLDIDSGVTVIVGPNGVGKSNFVDAMRFVRDAALESLDAAVLAREGTSRIKQRVAKDALSPHVGFGVFCEDTVEGDDEPIAHSYEFSMALDAAGGFQVLNEKTLSQGVLSWPLEKDAWIESSFTRDQSGQLTINDGSLPADPSYPTRFHYSDRLALGALNNSNTHDVIGSNLLDFFEGWKIATIYPITLRKPKTLDKESSLREDGSNWASIIRTYKRTEEGAKTLIRIYECMRVLLPKFREVEILEVGSYLIPSFKFSALEADVNLNFDPVQLSDGTLRLFGILLAAYQIPRPSLLIIEEPEQTIYPGALRLLADVFKEISSTTQVIITTHSPHLVQQFAPHQIRVATMENGTTQIHKIHPHQREAVEEGLLSLEEFMTQGGLQPDDSAPASEV